MPRIQPGDSQRERDEFEARSDGLILHLGGKLPNPHRDARLFTSQNLRDHMRDFHGQRNERHGDGLRDNLTREIAAYERGLSTSHLPGLVENVFQKLAMQGYAAAPVTYPLWCSAASAENFQRTSAVGLSDFPSLPKVPELGEIPAINRSDRTERFTLERYAARFTISDQVLFGDDANLLVRSPLEFGKAARFAVQREVSNLLKLNSGTGPTLNATGAALFSTTHGNYVNPGAAPTVTTLDEGRRTMRLRTDATSGEVLNCVPRVLLVPAALETQARVLVASQNSPLSDQEGDLLVAVDPNLDGGTNGSTSWYLAGDPQKTDGVSVVFLGGLDAPTIETTREWDVDGVQYRVSHFFAVVALDSKALFRNRGA